MIAKKLVDTLLKRGNQLDTKCEIKYVKKNYSIFTVLFFARFLFSIVDF